MAGFGRAIVDEEHGQIAHVARFEGGALFAVHGPCIEHDDFEDVRTATVIFDDENGDPVIVIPSIPVLFSAEAD